MITPNQIRAARALLNLGQGDIHEGTGITVSALSNIEKGKTTPTSTTLDTLQKYFEGNGIEFLTNDGVHFKPGERTYRGTSGIQKFFDDVYITAKNEGGEICIFNGVPDLLIKWLGEGFYQMHAERMSKIKKNFKFKIIVEKGEDNLIASGFAEYRAFPKEKFSDQTIYIFGNKTGFFDFTNDDVFISVSKDIKRTKSQRVLFDFAWEKADKIK